MPADEYVEQLQAIGAQISMSAVGNPYDNAKAESFFKTLKQEEVYLKEYDSFTDAEQNLTVFIEKVYNEKRLHSSLGYVPPAEFEAAFTPITQKLTLLRVRQNGFTPATKAPLPTITLREVNRSPSIGLFSNHP